MLIETALIGTVSMIIYIVLTFVKLKISTLFIDFTVFVASIILAIAISYLPVENTFTLAVIVFLYINAIWLYGIENKEVSKKKYVFNPSISRVFIGLILFIVAVWMSFSTIDIRIALINVLIALILGVFKLRSLEKK